MLPAALVLTIMIIPITSAICRELFERTPRDLMDGAMALGSTRWEAIRGVMFAYAAPGIAAAVLLGLGRAFGEAIAVTQVIGGADFISRSLFAPADTLASRIASQYQGAPTPLMAGLDPLPRGDPDGDLARHERRRAGGRAAVREGAAGGVSEHPRARRSVRHHRPLERACGAGGSPRRSSAGSASLSAVLAVAILALVLGTVISKGLERASTSTSSRSRDRSSARPAASQTRSSAARSSSGMAMLMAIPVAVLVAIFMSEYASPGRLAGACGSSSTS